VAPAGLAAEGAVQGGLDVEGGDREHLVARFQPAAASTGEHSLAADHCHHDRALWQVEVGDAPADGRGVLVQADLHQGDPSVLMVRVGRAGEPKVAAAGELVMLPA
jgi:hypothetical protein